MTGTNFAGYMAKSKHLTLITLVLTVVPFFYEPWYLALPIAVGVQGASVVVRSIFMMKSDARMID